MDKLNREQIEFIDNYLHNSGIRYKDIRYEMTDHVASAIEGMNGSFGDNFSKYMLDNKRQLLANNKIFKSQAFSKAMWLFKRNCTKPMVLLSFFALLAMTFAGNKFWGYDEVYTVYLYIHLCLYTLCYASWCYFWVGKSNRYSVIDRLLLFTFFVPMLFRLEKVIDNQTVVSLFLPLYTFTLLILLATIISYHKKYRASYEG